MFEAARRDSMYSVSPPTPYCVLTAASADRLVQPKDEFGSLKGVIKQVLLPLSSVCILTLIVKAFCDRP